MLKHRYDNLSESLSDFDRMLDGMNSVQPLERQQVDEDLLAMFREEQELIRFERQIEHLYSAVYGSGMPISESEVKALQQAHAAAAAKYNDAAAATIAKIKALSAAHDTTMKEKMLALKTRFQLKAREHGTLASGPDKKKEIVASVTESTRPRARSVLGDFRRLAGIDEAVQMPRDPGLLGTTRFNAEYEQMAQPFDEGRSKDQQADGTKAMAMKSLFQASQKDAGDMFSKSKSRSIHGARAIVKDTQTPDYLKSKEPGETLRIKKSLDALKGKKVEGLSIEDRIAALREGRSKEQQAAGLKASYDGGHNFFRPTDSGNKEVTKDDVKHDSDTPRVKRALRRASGRNDPQGLSADMLTHKQNMKSWPNGENIVKRMTKRGGFLTKR
jgi:hypothetical protein